MNCFFSTKLLIFLCALTFSVHCSTSFLFTTNYAFQEQGGYITPSKDNQYFVAGSSTEDSVGGYDIVVRKISASGVETWTQRYGCYLNDYANDVILDKYGFCVVLGSRNRGCDPARPVIPIMLNYSSNGVMVWAHEILTDTFTARSMMLQTLSGSGIVLAGYDGIYGALLYINYGDSRIIKTASASITGCTNVRFEKAVEDLSRNIGATGYCTVGASTQCVFALYDGTSFFQSSSISSYNNAKCTSVARLSTGSFMLGGMVYSTIYGFTIIYENSVLYRWIVQNDFSFGGNSNDKLAGILELPDGRIALAASVNNIIYTYLLDSSLIQIGSNMGINGGLNAVSLAPSKTGEILVSGTFSGSYTRIFVQSLGCSYGWYVNPSNVCLKCEIGTYSAGFGGLACSPCGPGNYGTMQAAYMCTPCNMGTYQDLAGQTSCKGCLAGTYADIMGLSSCKDCAAGSYQDLSGASSCTQCMAGTYNPNMRSSSSSSCIPCSPGTYAASPGSASCTDCPAGTYQPSSGQSSCISCNAGFYNLYTKQIAASVCLPCQIGFEQPSMGSSSCNQCGPGYYNSATGMSSCTACPTGTYNALYQKTLLSDCLPCAIGYYQSSTGSSSCILCEAGFYQDATGQASCTPCPEGTYNSMTGQTSSAACLACPVGTSNSLTGQSSCTPCQTGYFQTATGTTSCIACPAGQYQDITGQTGCKQCPVGKYSSSTGQSSCTDCSAGTYQDAIEQTSCKQCAVGTFQANTGSTSCTDCVAGQYQDQLGQSSCVSCPAGTYSLTVKSALATNCLPCEVGKAQSSTGSTSCNDCQAGEYQDTPGSSTCKLCPAGTAQPLTAQTSVDACTPCGAGYIAAAEKTSACTKCAPGTYSTSSGASACTPCEAGTAANDEARGTACPDCPAGTFASGTGATVCTPCAAGSYSLTAKSTACTPCEEGTASNTPGISTLCPDCAAGSFSTGTGNTACTPCAAGTYQTAAKSNSCTQCEAGTASSDTGRSTACPDCLAGEYSAAGASTCSKCQAGEFQTATKSTSCSKCLAGTASSDIGRITACTACLAGYYAATEGLSTCSKCLAGEYQLNPGQTSCSPCDAGTASTAEARSTACDPCDIGTYSSSTGATTCTQAPAGAYQTGTGSTNFIQCAAGSASNILGRTTICDPCAAGSFATGLGNTACSPCAAGTYQANPGQGSCDTCTGNVDMSGTGRTTPCDPCPIGTYFSVGACTPCNAGTYSDTTGASSCTPCPINTYSTATGGNSASSCISCGIGMYTTTTGQTTCIPVPSGGYVDPGTGQLVTCSAGTYLSGSACVSCTDGTYQPNTGATSCLPCPAGAYCTGTGLSAYAECSAGTYNPNTGATSSTACLPCPAGSYATNTMTSTCTQTSPGQYALEGATTYSLCDPGSYQPSSGQSSCLPCGAGFYEPNSGASSCATLCSPASYSTGGASSCTPCEINTIQLESGKSSCAPCPNGGFTLNAGSNECLYCGAGQYISNPSTGACGNCAEGTYSTTFGATACTPCAAGTYQPNTGQSSCLPCAAGSYQDETGKTTCKACLAGTANNIEGQSSCPACAAGTVQPNTGQNTCLPCSAGTSQSSTGQTTCSPCLEGTYSAAGASTCTPCDAGTVIATTSASACEPCPAGTYQPDTGKTTCIDCDIGWYQATPGSASCSKCPAGKYTTATKQSTCISCDAGTEQPNEGQNGCIDCVAGYYQPQTGQANCLPCPAGQYSTTVKQTTCQLCSAGQKQPLTGQTACESCEAGAVQPNTGQSACIQCTAGNFQELTDYTACKKCPVGTFQTADGQTSCIDCPVGKYQDVEGQQSCKDCLAGQYQDLTKQTACKSCLAGTYQPDPGKDICLDCLEGTVQPNTGQSSCTKCTAGYFQASKKQTICTICPVGEYSVGEGNIICTKCAVGNYQDLEGQSLCKQCPAGEVQDLEGKSTCNKCVAGTYQPELGKTICIDCEAGYYQDAIGQAACVKCPAGQFTSTTKQTACSLCAAGKAQPLEAQTTCNDCDPGSYQPDTGKASCLPCPLGKVQPTAGQTSCTDCVAGTHQPETGKTTCIDCDVGYFQDQTGQELCKACLAGEYTNIVKQTVCAKCDVGTYQPDTGKTVCIDCPIGQVQPLTGKATCDLCLAGEFQDQTKQTTCKKCSAGMYQDLTGKEICKQCPQGTYSGSEGAAACTPCDPNWFSASDFTKCLYWGVFDTTTAFDADQVSTACRPSGVLTKPYTPECRAAFHTLCCDGATKKAAINCNHLLGIAMTGDNLKDKYCSACYFLDSSKCPADQLCWDDSKYLANTDDPFPVAGYTVPCLDAISGYCGSRLNADMTDGECAKIVGECGATLVSASYGNSWNTFKMTFSKKLPGQILTCTNMFDSTRTPGILNGNAVCTRESDTVIAVSVLGLAVPLTTFGFKLNTVKDACGVYINIASQTITPPAPDSILIYGSITDKCEHLIINSTVTKSYPWDISGISWDVSYNDVTNITQYSFDFIRNIINTKQASIYIPEWHLYSGKKLRIQANFLNPFNTIVYSNIMEILIPPTTYGKPYCGPCQFDFRTQCPQFNGICWEDYLNNTIKGPNNSSDCISMAAPFCYKIWLKNPNDPQCADFVPHLNFEYMKIWPKLLSAFYAISGKSITFVFDTPVRTAGASVCYTIFSPTTLRWLPTTCSINWVNLTAFSVDYDTTNGIMTEATIKSGALFFNYPYSVFSVNETTVNITLPKFEPIIKITGNTLLSECDTANLFATIVNPTLYTTLFKWDIEFAKNLADNLKLEAQTLFAPLSQYSSTSTLTIPSKFMVRGSNIVVTLTVKAANFNYDTFQVKTILQVVANVPKVSIGSKTQLVLELDGTKSTQIPIQLTTYKCGEDSEPIPVEVKLLVATGDNPLSATISETSELAIQTKLNDVYADFGSIFVGERQGFAYSKYYNITAAVIDKVSGLYNSDTTIIFLVRPPIKAIIKSAGSLVSIVNDLTLNGADSEFPVSDDEIKEFGWKCVSATPMEIGGTCTCPLLASSELKSRNLIIPKVKLANICKYVFGLAVTSTSKNSKRAAYNETEFTTINIPVEPAFGQVIGGTSNVVQDEYFTFSITQKPGVPEPTYEWSLTEIQSMDPAVGTNYTEKNTFIYDFFKNYLNANIDPTIKDNDRPLPGGRRLLEEIAPAYITPTDTRVLGVDKEALLARHKYTFGVIVKYDGVPTYLFITFETPQKPRNRIVTVSPASGTAFSTPFAITFVLETPTGSDSAQYQIFRKNCPGSTNAEVPLTQPFTSSNMYTASLSSGLKSCDYKVEIIVRTSEFGGTIENQVDVTVLEPSAPMEVVLAAQIEKLTSVSTASAIPMDQKLTMLAEIANVPVTESSPNTVSVANAVIEQISVLDKPGGFMDLIDPEDKPELIGTTVQTLGNVVSNQAEAVPASSAEAVGAKVEDYLVAVKTEEGGSFVIPGCLAALSGIAGIGTAKQSEKEFFSAMQRAMDIMTDMKLAEMLPGAAPFTVTSPSIEMIIKKVYASEFNKSQSFKTGKGASIDLPSGLSEKFISQLNGSLTGTPVIGTAIYATTFNPFTAVRNATNISVSSLSNETLPGIQPTTVQRIYEDLAQGKLQGVVNKKEQNADLLQIGFKPSQVLPNSTQVPIDKGLQVGKLDDGKTASFTFPVSNLSTYANNSLIVPVFRNPKNDTWSNENCTMQPIIPKVPHVIMVCKHMGVEVKNATKKDLNFQATVDIMKDVFKVIKAGNYEQLGQVNLLLEGGSRSIAAGLFVVLTLVALATTVTLLINLDKRDLFKERMRFLERKFGGKKRDPPAGIMERVYRFFARVRKNGLNKVTKKSQGSIGPARLRKLPHKRTGTDVPLIKEKKKPANGFTRLTKADMQLLKDMWYFYKQCLLTYDDNEVLDIVNQEVVATGILNRKTQAYIDNDIVNEPLSFWTLLRNEHPMVNAVAKPEITTPRPYKLMIIVCTLLGELFLTGFFHDTDVNKSPADDYGYFLSNAIVFTIAATLLMIPMKVIISVFLSGSSPTDEMTREEIEAAEKKAPMKQTIGLVLGFGWVVGCLYAVAMYIVVFPDYALNNWMATFGISMFTEVIVVSNMKIFLKVCIGLLLMVLVKSKAMMTTAGVIAGHIIDYMGRTC